MENPPVNNSEIEKMTSLYKKINLEASIRNGMSWFYFIAVLSIVNSILYRIGGSITFIVGLGITQLVDGFTLAIANKLSGSETLLFQLIGFIINISFSSVFLVIGILSRKYNKLAIIVGMVLYSLDGLIFLAFQDWLPLAFHAFALFGLWKGYQSLNELNNLERNGTIIIPKELLLSIKAENDKKSKKSFYIVAGCGLLFLICFFAYLIIGIPLINNLR